MFFAVLDCSLLSEHLLFCLGFGIFLKPLEQIALDGQGKSPGPKDWEQHTGAGFLHVGSIDISNQIILSLQAILCIVGC